MMIRGGEFVGFAGRYEAEMGKPKKGQPVTEEELLKLVPIGPGEVRSKSLIKR